ncbi:MAG: acyl-CoA thioesterase domain-containing protein [Devosia sp.]
MSLPAIHGGAAAAALSLAALGYAERNVEPGASWRFLTISINYLRAVQAATVDLKPTLRKRGTRSCVISVSALQASKEVTHAECLLAKRNMNE